MGRINITETDEYTEETRLVGWFDPGAATVYQQGHEFDGNNMIGTITRNQWIDEWLLRTAGGRWVIHRDASRHFNGPDTYRFVDDDEAGEWLLRSSDEDAAAAVVEHFGPVGAESGPGRPEVGPAFSVRFPRELLAQVDAAASATGMTRAAWLRHAAEGALD